MLLSVGLGPAHAGNTERLSLDSAGNEAGAASFAQRTSANGRWVAFNSLATNLVENDTNAQTDVFLRDRKTGQTRRVSVSTSGVQGNSPSLLRAISADGRKIAFVSLSSNLVVNDTNNTFDIFVHDRISGITERASVANDGSQANGLSEDASLSADGRYVAFRSEADNLVAGDTNIRPDVFLRDRTGGTTVRVSVAIGGGQSNGESRAPSLSANGRQVAFESSARNLVTDDINGDRDVFVHDLDDAITERVSTASDGTEANGVSNAASLSADGLRVAFTSVADNLVAGDTNDTGEGTLGQDVFVHDRQDGTTRRVSVASAGTEADGQSARPMISASGQSVAFESMAANLVADDTNVEPDVFLHVLDTATTTRVSVDSAGSQGNRRNEWPGVDGTGRRVVFHALSDNLVPDDTNRARDTFLHDRGADCDVNADEHRFTLPPNQWVTLSLPCEPPPGTTIAELFGDNISGDYVEAVPSPTSTWVIYTYDSSGATPDYVNPGADGTLAMGQGFWIIQRTPTSVMLDLPEGSRGVATDFSARAACLGSAGCSSTSLSGSPMIPPDEPSWNLAGNPFDLKLPQGELRVTTETGTCSSAGCSLSEAYALPLGSRVAFDTLFHYDGSIYQELGPGSEILRWQGFWLGELAGASGNSPVLQFPESR